MTRTAKLKCGYVVALAVLALAGLAIVRYGGSTVAVIAVALLLFIPGRIQGIYYRDLFTGRRLLDAGQYAKSIPFMERFLESMQLHPRRGLLLWLSWSIYTPSVVAMTLNNIGAARLNLGEIDASENAFSLALAQDPLYPLPHFNMAVIHELRANRARAAEALAMAHHLGYRGGTLDAVVHKAQSVLAAVEGSAT